MLVMPLMTGGSCAAVIRSHFPTGIKDDGCLARILYEALKGLIYLHGDNRLHRDIKAGNILLGGRNKRGEISHEVKLADFGVAGSTLHDGKRRGAQTFTGTPCWMAPEVMENLSTYDSKADIWSFGITALELAYGQPPYVNFPPLKVLLKTLQEPSPTAEIYNDNSHTFSSSFHSLVKKCLHKTPAKRPTAKELLEHRFFSKRAKDCSWIFDRIGVIPANDETDVAGATSSCFQEREDSGNTDAKRRPAVIPAFTFDEDVLQLIDRARATNAVVSPTPEADSPPLSPKS